MKGGTMRKKFKDNPLQYIYNFMCTQIALNIIFGAIIIVLVLALISMKERITIIADSAEIAIDSGIKLAQGSDKVSRDIMKLRSDLDVLETMQQQIIARSPELYKQHEQMFNSAAKELRTKIDKRVEELKREQNESENKKGRLHPTEKGLRLDLDGLGEYAI